MMRHASKVVVFVCCALALVQWGCSNATKEGQAINATSNGQAIYESKCKDCHGLKGEPLLPMAPDLRTSTLSLEERKRIIREGKGSMPSHQSALDPSAIEEVAKYIETFR